MNFSWLFFLLFLFILFYFPVALLFIIPQIFWLLCRWRENCMVVICPLFNCNQIVKAVNVTFLLLRYCIKVSKRHNKVQRMAYKLHHGARCLLVMLLPPLLITSSLRINVELRYKNDDGKKINKAVLCEQWGNGYQCRFSLLSLVTCFWKCRFTILVSNNFYYHICWMWWILLLISLKMPL